MSDVSTASLELLASFGQRLAAGLRERIEGGATAGEPRAEKHTRDAIAQAVPGGALLVHAIWFTPEGERTGAIVWSGPVSTLLGIAETPISDLTEEDASALGDSLRLNLEEGGDGELPFDWTSIEPVSPENLSGRLASAGFDEEPDGASVSVAIAAGELSFLLLIGPLRSEESAGPSVEEVAETEATVAAGSRTAPTTATIPDHLMDVRIPLSIRLGSTSMNLDEILRLSPGAIVELDQREEEPLEVVANGRVIARGEVVVVDERFGLRITDVGSSGERLSAL